MLNLAKVTSAADADVKELSQALDVLSGDVLERVHWSEKTSRFDSVFNSILTFFSYADYGLHTKNVKLNVRIIT